MKLLQTCVAPSLLYAAGTWTLTAEQENKILTTQRSMVRKIVGVRRRSHETWVEYIQRATRTSTNLAFQNGVQDWVSSFWKQKWSLAGMLSTAKDGRWAARLLDWKPWFRVDAKRSVGGQRKRWADV